jgi:hypothetical protein
MKLEIVPKEEWRPMGSKESAKIIELRNSIITGGPKSLNSLRVYDGGVSMYRNAVKILELKTDSTDKELVRNEMVKQILNGDWDDYIVNVYRKETRERMRRYNAKRRSKRSLNK